MKDVLRIGCGGGFWGDSAEGPEQLVDSGEIDVLVLDYLAEITMSLLARARAKDPQAGYASDFPGVVAALAPRLAAQKIRLVTNAGGVNPEACRDAIATRLAALGIPLKIGIVTGDDLLARSEEFREAGVREMFSGAAFPQGAPWSSNAYLGAFPIAAALAAGADIVITGRCVDSALVLGPLVHAFGWTADDYDRLAAGSLAGHVLECGVQATGGIVTDWRKVAMDWDRMGFPIAAVRADGSFTLGKPAGTGGRLTPETVAEQVVYEVGDPGAYLLPDVTCDWREVRLRQLAPDRVDVSGARGAAPGGQLKVSTTFQDGYRSTAMMMLGGVQAVDKAQAVAAAILKRTRRLFTARGLKDYTRTDVEVLGSESNWGAHARAKDTREVILKISVQHAEKAALELFSREVIPAATSMAQGITGFSGGRPTVTPLVRLFSWLIDEAQVVARVAVDGKRAPGGAGERRPSPGPVAAPARPAALSAPAGAVRPGVALPCREVPLLALAYARSGDKGDTANIGVLARRAEDLPLLNEQLTASTVAEFLAHVVKGSVQRFDWPGLGGFNFLLHEALGGGGMASLRHDPQGKLLAQVLMDLPIRVPIDWQAPSP